MARIETGSTLRGFAPFLPTVAMLVGLVGLRNAWVALVLYHAGIVACLIAARERPRWGRPPRWMPGAVVVSFLGGPVLALGWPLFAGPDAQLSDKLAAFDLTGASWWAFAIYYVVVNPGLEEAFWRGWLAPATERVHWHDAAFAAYHGVVLGFFIGPVWIAVTCALLVGAAWVWRAMAQARGGLAGPVVTHLAADLGIIGAALWMLRGA